MFRLLYTTPGPNALYGELHFAGGSQTRVSADSFKKSPACRSSGLSLKNYFFFSTDPVEAGKTTYINTVMAMFGPTLGVKLPTSALLTGVRGGNTESSAIAKLRAARFACCSELPQKRSFKRIGCEGSQQPRCHICKGSLFEPDSVPAISHTYFVWQSKTKCIRER